MENTKNTEKNNDLGCGGSVNSVSLVGGPSWIDIIRTEQVSFNQAFKRIETRVKKLEKVQ